MLNALIPTKNTQCHPFISSATAGDWRGAYLELRELNPQGPDSYNE